MYILGVYIRCIYQVYILDVYISISIPVSLMIVICLFQLVVRTLAIIITAIAANPYTVISVFFLLLTFVGMRWYYLKTGRDIKRLEALGMSMQL